MAEKVILTLYIAGSSPRSERAVQNIQQIRADLLGDSCDIAVIDVMQEPKRAEDARILATPTLVREQPLPERRIIGDLSDTQRVLHALNIAAK
jgi:circadian clock protein KaiB